MAAGDVTAESFSNRKACLARAREHLNNRAFRAARNTLDKGLRQWPALAFEHEYLTLLGHVAWRQRRLREARRCLQLAARQEDCHVEARYLLGRALLDGRRTEDAVRVLDAVLHDDDELVPYRVHAGGALSVAYSALGLNKSSQDALEKSAGFGLISGQLLADEGYRLMRIGAYPEAEVQLAKGLQVDATCEDAFFRLATALMIQNKLDPAQEVLAYGIEQSPENVNFYELMARMYEMRGQHKESAAFLKRALEVSPECDGADAIRFELACSLYHAGRLEAATLAFTEMIQQHPRSELRRLAELRLTALQARQTGAKAARLTGFPRKLQKRAFCAPNTLANVLSFAGKPVSQEEVAARVFRGGGTRWPEIFDYLAGVEGIAWRAYFGSLDLLRRCVDAGLPVITTEYWGMSGHALAVIGYDDTGRLVIAQDPRFLEPVEIPYAEFEQAWRHDDGLCIAVAPAGRKKHLPGISGDDERLVRGFVEALRAVGEGKLPQAAAAAEDLAQSAPEKQAPLRLSAEIALMQRDFKKVTAVAQRALKLWPDCFWALRFLGDAAWLTGDAAGALARFHAARQVDNRDPVLAYAMGELLLSIGQRKQGRALLVRALREDSRFHAARLRLAEDCFATGEDVAGKLHARLLIEYEPDHEKARALLAAKAGATAVITLADTARRVNESIQARQDAPPAQKAAPKKPPEEDEIEVDLDEI
ncbi:MAG: tetratricopeptide repeat protein [Planctomycetes bacterium]|nr:tetratricopeptide repeat protein [Planctomycetota bacterium]MCL4730812.1 tetratricopeptide repeat protein [Planctomycetota bacterium]